MTLKSKRAIASIAMSICCLIAYTIYALSQSAPKADDLKTWAIVILVALGITIGVLIVAQIVVIIFHVIGVSTKELVSDKQTVEKIMETEMLEDERDKQIMLKSSHIGYLCVGIGIVTALITLAFGALALTALHILLGACFAALLADGIISVVLYEKGTKR